MRGDFLEGTFEGTKVPLKNGGPNSIRGNTQLSVRTESFDWPK